MAVYFTENRISWVYVQSLGCPGFCSIAEDIERVPREYCGYGGEFDQQIEQMYPGA